MIKKSAPWLIALALIVTAISIGAHRALQSRAALTYEVPPVAVVVPVDPVPASYDASQPGVPRLVSVGAGKCIPCRAMAPISAELRQEYAGALVVDFYDLWKDPAVGDHFNVHMIPTLIFYDADRRELGRLVGYTPKKEILKAFSRWGVRLARADAHTKS